MRILITIMLTGLLSLAMAAIFAGNTLAQQNLAIAPYLAGGTAAVFTLGDNASVPVLPVFKGGHGHRGFHRGFRGGFFLGYPGWGYGGYGGYPYGSYTGSYLDTPTRSCVWNGYEYRCYNFQTGDSYLY